MAENTKFVFRKHDKVGVADALADKSTLLNNFVDTGDYKCLEDFSRPERFILGRAGVGKTALITRLVDEHENTIVINPDSLSLGYVSNSTIIRVLSEIGVDFELFFRLLWRHVLGVEVLKYHFGIGDQKIQISVMEKLKDKFSKSSKRTNHAKALDYLEKWGSSFWQDTDYRIKELTSSIESDIKANIGVKNAPVLANLEAGKSIVETERAEIVYRTQEVVNGVQMKELADLMKMLDEAIDDKQKYYYLVVDRLDEDWVDDVIRYKLIKALLETVKDFNVVKQVKPMIVLRNDLIGRVYDQTRRSGFQEEKFTTLDLPIKWTKDQLLELLDKRINYLIKQRYVGSSITHRDIMPTHIEKEDISSYLVDRTLMRPRDLIRFFNLCIEEAVDSAEMTQEMIIKAEREYSRDRHTSIRDEWYEDYPYLEKWDKLLQGKEREFFSEDIAIEEIEAIVLTYDSPNPKVIDRINDLLIPVLEEKMSYAIFRKHLLQIFYQVGFTGVKLPDNKDYIWSYQSRKMLHVEEISDDVIFKMHPCFWSCFNIKQ